MKAYKIILPSLAVIMSACATVTPVPSKRPISAEAKAQIDSVDVNLDKNETGVGASWFMTQSNGGGAGLAGAIGAAIADAIINWAPSKRASTTANEVAENIVADDLNASLTAALNSAKVSAEGDIKLGNIELVNAFNKSVSDDGKLAMSVTYQLAEDASAFRATARTSYENAAMPYQTPYVFEGSVPKSQTKGPLYQNTFTFNSTQFPLPDLTDDLKAKLVTAIEDGFRMDDGTLPTDGGDYKKMQKAIEKAKDDKLTKSEASIFLVQSWLANGASPLKGEIEQAHSFFAKYIPMDLNSTEVPSMTGQDQILETLANGRVVKIIGEGLQAGAYVSEPGNVSSFSTYGNATNYSAIGVAANSAARKAGKAAGKGK